MKKGFSFLFGWCVIVAVLLWSVRLWALQPNFYIHMYEQMDLADSLDVSQADLNRSIVTLLDYLKDERSNIKVNINHHPAFDRRETLHMKDVKRLYQNAMTARNVASIGAILIGVWMVRKKHGSFFLSKGYLRAGFSFLCIMALLSIWILTNFTDFWIHFHKLFFTNDYWILTPGVDFMIDMLPEPVFNRLVISIVVSVVACLGALAIGAWLWLLKRAPIGFEEDS